VGKGQRRKMCYVKAVSHSHFFIPSSQSQLNSIFPLKSFLTDFLIFSKHSTPSRFCFILYVTIILFTHKNAPSKPKR